MANEATFSVTGYVATPPKGGYTRNGTRTLYMRVGWTPRRMDKRTGEWTDQPTSFVGVTCYRKVAENGAACLRRGDPVVVKGTLIVREYGEDKRIAVEVFADSIGHDLSRGVTIFKKNSAQLEQTALERERAMAAEGRAPLPDDLSRDGRGTGEWHGRPDEIGPDFGGPDAEEPDLGEPDVGVPDLNGPDDSRGALDSGRDEPFDEDEARQMLAQASESAEPASVPA
jgi:single-strand DNA-binding protein